LSFDFGFWNARGGGRSIAECGMTGKIGDPGRAGTDCGFYVGIGDFRLQI
jgi:hypothetical protein